MVGVGIFSGTTQYPYPPTGGKKILTPPPPTLDFGNSKILYLPCPLNSKSVNLSSPPEFPVVFLRPFGIPI